MEYFDIQQTDGAKKISARLYNKSSDKLVVLLNGLRAIDKQASIFYNRLSWVKDIPYNCLYISDPTLLYYKELRGGYYQGTNDIFGINSAADLIKKIAVMLKVTEENILLYGSSQGGFAALMLRFYLTDVRILSECPQTDLSILTSPLSKKDRLAMIKSVYNVEDFESLSDDAKHKINVLKTYQKYRLNTKNIKVLVKETDIVHRRDHIIPLVTIFPEVELEIFCGEYGRGGHTALDKKIIIENIITSFK